MGRKEVDRALDRPAEYFFEDGLWEIVVGLWLGSTLALPLWAAPGPKWESHIYFALFGALALLRPVVLAAKDRWIHPRTGHVTYPEPEAGSTVISLDLGPSAPTAHGPGGQRRAAYVRSILIPGAFTLGVVGAFAASRRLGFGDAGGHAVVGLGLGTAFLVAARHFRQRRWIGVAVALALLGVAVALGAPNRETALPTHAAGVAFTLVASGTWALCRTVRRAPRPEAETDA